MFENIISLLQDNKFLVAGLGVSSVGLISFWLKDVPLRIISFVKRHSTTTLIIKNYDLFFYELADWLTKENAKKNFRTLKVSNGQYGSDTTITSMGYGNHIVFFKNNILFINYSSEKESISERPKEIIQLVKLGRSKKLFLELISIINQSEKDSNDIKLYRMEDGYWEFNKNLIKRNIESVFIEQSKKNLIFSNLKEFQKKEQWYVDHGLPYQYGILLYGEPGTGKTSLIRAIATELNYNIYYLPPSKMNTIEKALNSCKEKSIVVIEDIDTSSAVQERSTSNKEDNADPDDLFKAFNITNLSDILNALDGLSSVHGRLLICTTNHIEKLDKALIRPGRFDLLIKVSYVNKEICEQFFNCYFPNNSINFEKINIGEKITVAEMQNMILLGHSEKDILANITKI